MREITIKSYAKINLSLDVLGILPNGYHEIETVMQQIKLHDEVTVGWEPEVRDDNKAPKKILLTVGKAELPTDENNIAYRAAALMMRRFQRWGRISIHIEKNVPIAAGLAGGSGNGGAVIHGLNFLWGLGLSVKELCEIGVDLGADVPFCIMGQAKSNEELKLQEDEQACTCALAEGIGEKLTPLPPLNCKILLSKPSIGVSTAEVYKGIDRELNLKKPMEGDRACLIHHMDTWKLVKGLKEGNNENIISNMSNILELFSTKSYPTIMYTKDMIEQQGSAAKVLMSGSGPTVFAIYLEGFETQELQADYERLRELNRETYLTETLV